MTIYLFGIFSGHSTTRNIFNYFSQHLKNWFPNLGGYEAFNYRLNRIANGFESFCMHLLENHPELAASDLSRFVVDSAPIVLARASRSKRAKVAKELADKGYCSSKDLFFHGVKLHCIGICRESKIPKPCFIGVFPASTNDNQALKQISPELINCELFGDKAYEDAAHKKQLLENQDTTLITPRKKSKNLFNFLGDDTFSSWVSSIRQPIESFFNWLQEKTKIQNASKVRSAAGLKVHVFGRLATALLCFS